MIATEAAAPAASQENDFGLKAEKYIENGSGCRNYVSEFSILNIAPTPCNRRPRNFGQTRVRWESRPATSDANLRDRSGRKMLAATAFNALQCTAFTIPIEL